MSEPTRMTLAEAKAWLGDRWVLAKPVVRLDLQPPRPEREIPRYIKAGTPMFLRRQSA